MDFNSLDDYRTLYYVLIFVFFIIGYITNSFHKGKKHYVIYAIILLLSLFIGNRPINVGADTIAYQYMFDGENGKSLTDTIGKGAPLFVLLLRFCSIFGDVHFCFTLISFITLLGTYLFAKKICENEDLSSPLLLFFSMISMDIFFNQQFNIIRTGIAAVFLYFFFYELYYKQYKTALIYAFISIGLHISMFIPIVILLFINCIKIEEKYYISIYLLSIIVSFFGYGVHSISDYLLGYDYRQVQQYLSGEDFDYKVGFRVDFLIFNTFFLVFFLYLRKLMNMKSDFFDYCIKYYILTSVVFILWFYIPFSDRIGAFSWNFIPVIFYIGICKSFSKRKNYYALLSFNLIYFINIFLFVL